MVSAFAPQVSVFSEDETFEQKCFAFEFQTTPCIGNSTDLVIQKLQINFKAQKYYMIC